MTGDLVRVESADGVLTIVLARPAKRNALTGAMYDALTAALMQADAEPQLRAVLICAQGDDFCAGNDIGDFLAAGAGAAAPALAFVRQLARCATPLVAAVQGSAYGIGATLLLHCDLVLAAADARFRFPFVDLGLVPEAGSSLLLPRRVGDAKAAEWLMLGTPFDAAEALRHGFVNVVGDAADLHARAREAVLQLAAKPPAALAATRRLLRGDPAPVLRQIEAEAEAFALALASPEARAAFQTFLDRSRP